jgi:CRISP-associated protein Cas1
MIKKTLVFSNPYYLSMKQSQLIVKGRSEEKQVDIVSIPIEDIGCVLLENPQISFSMKLLTALTENNVSVVICNDFHMPSSMLLPLDGNATQNEVIRDQLASSLTLKKQLWKRTVEKKIENQASHLRLLSKTYKPVSAAARDVKSMDSSNREGYAAKLYWSELFGHIPGFSRSRYGPFPNNLLNYGYAILRAAVARSLVGSGLLPAIGIFHHNKYNAFCLADDMMEPYRPFVDRIVYDISLGNSIEKNMNTEYKKKLLEILTADVIVKKVRRPLQIGLTYTTASLAKSFRKGENCLSLPSMMT